MLRDVGKGHVTVTKWHQHSLNLYIVITVFAVFSTRLFDQIFKTFYRKRKDKTSFKKYYHEKLKQSETTAKEIALKNSYKTMKIKQKIHPNAFGTCELDKFQKLNRKHFINNG